MKRSLIISSTLLIIVAAIAASLLWWKSAVEPFASGENYQNFVIPRGYSASQIGNKLEEKGIIKNALAFKFYSQLTGRSKKILAGEYELSSHLSLLQIVDLLTKGPVELWVTVPEGLRSEEVAERFIAGLEKQSEEAGTFRSEFLSLADGEEGYLFPDTYLFPREASASSVVNTMTNTFDKKMEALQEGIDASNLSLNEIVTLASIVERESRKDDERPVVAGILLNRLEIGMGLQADATVQYVIASQNCTGEINCNWWSTITRDDLSINSPYNTYRFRGLPPGPIANPGYTSLEAVVYPGETDYLYYLHDSDGNIHYANTLDEHNANVRNYLGK